MKDIRGVTALITGGSSGIGEEFARQLAERGCKLFLAARSEAKLRELCRELSSARGVRADYLPIDLSVEGAAAQLFDETEKRGASIDLLINNAGFGSLGEFALQPLERELQMIHLNIVVLVDLTHRYLSRMIARRNGAIINVASTAGFQPVPYMANYAATKAFVLHFSEALWAESKRHGVTVMALCPGATATGFFDAAKMNVRPPDSFMQSSKEVVEAALKALAAGKSSVITGWKNKLMIASERFVPRRLALAVASKLIDRRN